MVACSVYIKVLIQVRIASRKSKGSMTQVVRMAGALSLWEDNGLRCLKVNLMRGRVKPIGNGSAVCRVVEATTNASVQ